jgi:hypothetical protein
MTQPTQMQRQQQNQNGQQRPHKDLDLYQEAVNPSLTDDFLNDNNLGLGNLTEAEVYQQIQSYRAGMFAEAALSDRLDTRRIQETKRALAEEGCQIVTAENIHNHDGWDDLDDEERGEKDRRRYLEERGEEIWEQLPEEVQYQAVVDHTGVPNWMAPHYRMLLMRNEASKSKEARTQDNLFGRVKKVIGGGGSSNSKSVRERMQNLAGRNGDNR